MPILRLLRLAALGLIVSVAVDAATQVTRSAVIPRGRHPQILYWFFKPDSFQTKGYLSDLDRIAKESPFSLVYLTARGGSNFYDTKAMHPIFEDLVNHAHSLGLKVGLQLFAESKGATLEQAQGLVEETECRLDGHGAASFRAEANNLRGGRGAHALARQVLAGFAFKPSGGSTYEPGSLVQLEDGMFTCDNSDPKSIAVKVAAGDRYAGYTVYVMTVHYFPYGDVFSPFFEDSFGDTLSAYRDIPFDGTALDEFGTMRIERFLTRFLHPWTQRWYSGAFASFYQEHTGVPLTRALFDMRYSPRGDDTRRVQAINHYFDLWRLGVLKVERAFYAKSKQLFGPACFAGVHDTFHNRLTNDEYWATGLNWWEIPREYGQTDEDTPLATRFGIALGHPEKIPYNMFYSRSLGTILDETAKNLSFNSRVHYHAFNDHPTEWGVDFRDPAILARVAQVERKVRLVDQFDGPEPAMPILVVFGFPALANWYPDSGARNGYDMNGSLEIEEKAAKLWDAGYLCALIPSDKIDQGAVSIEGPGRVIYGGHVFSSVVYLDPEYAKETTLAFLEKLRASGTKYLIEGTASRDFEGHDIRARFSAIASGAVHLGFDLDAIPLLGAAKNDVAHGCRLADGSLLQVDPDGLIDGKPRSFAVTVGGRRYSGEAAGVLAIKADGAGRLEKLSAAGLRLLKRDDSVIISLSKPTDIVLRKQGQDTQVDLYGSGSEGASGDVISLP